MSQSSGFFKTVAKKTVRDRELERIIARITNLNAFTNNVRKNQAMRKIQKAWRSGKMRERMRVRQLVRNLQAGIVDNLANELNKLNLTNKNNNGNVIMANAPPLPKKKRKSANSNSNSNNNQTRAYRKRQVNLPNINIGGGGMGCGYAGIPRYMQRAQERFDNANVVSAFLDYTIATDQYGILKNISKILNRRGAANTSSRISVGKQIHFFMVGIRDVDKAHAISVLVDPGVHTNEFRMWVFDPHGQDSGGSIWGTTCVKR